MPYKVCIIVPVFNVEKHIARCAHSLFKQTFDEVQYVFVNDCTQDNSIEILKEIIELYPEKQTDIQIIHHPHNKGLGAARATGLFHSNSDFILNIDSDDYVAENIAELLYKKATETNADIVVCDFMIDWGKVKKVAPQPYSEDNVAYTKLLLNTQAMPGVVNKLIRRCLYFDNNIIPIEGIDVGEDYSITPRLAFYAKKIAKVAYPLYFYSQKNENSYTSVFSYKAQKSLVKAIEVLEIFFADKKMFSDSLLQGKLIKKIGMLMQSTAKERPFIATLYPETKSVALRTPLRFEERITLKLADKTMFGGLNLFLRLYNGALEIFQLLKGRRL